MYRTESSNDPFPRDVRKDPRAMGQADTEVDIDRDPVIADRSRVEDAPWPTASVDRRRTERRRIERMGTDI